MTGAPGAGKSSLVDKLALHYRPTGMTVGVIAVDPSSPFSRGDLWATGSRMQNSGQRPRRLHPVRWRRGATWAGWLARRLTPLRFLDAAGYDRTLVETVGVGQDEVMSKAADVSVVVLVPGMGDDIQAIKAGIMEIGDIFVINKADREGVERTEGVDRAA